MIFLSKGIPVRRTRTGDVDVFHCGALHKLTGQAATVWLSGLYQPCYIQTADQESVLNQLVEMGLAETGLATEAAAVFRLLTNCVLCPRDPVPILPTTNRTERRVWKWITRAGLHLTMAELVFLIEKDIRPVPGLLGEANRQPLAELIYTTETIYDSILECQMEHSPARAKTVQAVLGLLQKRKIFLL